MVYTINSDAIKHIGDTVHQGDIPLLSVDTVPFYDLLHSHL